MLVASISQPINQCNSIMFTCLQLYSTTLMRSLLSSLKLPTFSPELPTGYTELLKSVSPKPETLNARMEEIRALMLSELGDYGEKKFPSIVHRVRYSCDIQGLWYARADVLCILINNSGQTTAREKIAHISSRFIGLLPQSVTNKAACKLRQPFPLTSH